MEKEDEPSHGAGSGKKSNKKSSSKKAKSEEPKKNTQRLTEGDDNYPKDIPAGSKHYEKFWEDELREVIDQGARRICWIVASTGGLSAQLKIEGKVTSLKHFSLLHFLVGLFPKTDLKGGLRNLEHLKKFMEEQGAILEEDCNCTDPLAEMKRRKTDDKSKIATPVLCTHTHEDKPINVFRVKKLIVISKVVEKDLILLLNKQPVAISIVQHIDFAKFKGSGIYEGPKEDPQEDLDYHMMLCRGYGTLDRVHYWSVQNSAGRNWGENGYGKIIREVSRNGKPSLIKYIVYAVLLDAYVD